MAAAEIEQSEIRGAVGARDDFYQHINGSWLQSTSIPDDQAAWGPIAELEDRTQTQLQGLIEGLGSRPSDQQQQKIAILYASFMDEARVEALGAKPVQTEWARINALTDKSEVPVLIAYLNQTGFGAPFVLRVHQDARDSTHYIVDLKQSGLGLPSREFYLNPREAVARLRAGYQAHIEKMLSLAGDAKPQADAAATMEIETALAKSQWSSTDSRDPVKTYNKFVIRDLSGLVAGYDWHRYLTETGLDDKVKFLIVSQPSYMTAFGQLLQTQPLTAWKSYFKWRVLSASAPYLSKPFVDEHFAFKGTILRGVPDNLPRKRGAVTIVNDLIGEALGKLYAKQYFAAKTKDQIDAMAQIVIAAFRTRIKSLDWMSPETQKAAEQKLNHLVLKIGQPTQFREYKKLQFVEEDLFGNVLAGRRFEYQHQLAKLGMPIDRDAWQTLPQAVDPYYDAQLNEIALPAVILQAPFYDARAGAAFNYGGIGIVISRTLSQAFDDVGTQYAADGRLRNWLSGQDRDKFVAKTQSLLNQYDADETLGGQPVSGPRTFSEPLADNAGLAIAIEAYRLALAGKDGPMNNGLTGEQRFYARFAHIWGSKTREAESASSAIMDGQPAASVRIDAALKNQNTFATAFGLEDGDDMYLARSRRVDFW